MHLSTILEICFNKLHTGKTDEVPFRYDNEDYIVFIDEHCMFVRRANVVRTNEAVRSVRLVRDVRHKT